jgi:hypothetical protein
LEFFKVFSKFFQGNGKILAILVTGKMVTCKMLTALSRVMENWEERNEGGDFEQKVSYYTSPLMNL